MLVSVAFAPIAFGEVAFARLDDAFVELSVLETFATLAIVC